MGEVQGKKRIFIGLLCASLVLIFLIVGFLIYLVCNPQNTLYLSLLLVIGLVISVVLFLTGLGILLLIIAVSSQRSLGHCSRFFLRRALSLYPMALSLGGFFKIDKDLIRNSFIAVNNQLVIGSKQQFLPTEILVLAPHCLQKADCEHKITQDVGRCCGCGACAIAALVQCCQEYGVSLSVVTGGTLARKQIKAFHPQAIVAIACERDLSSGILDAAPLPVIGVLNSRPNGPCVNTTVEIDKVRQAIDFFLQPICVSA